MIRLRSALNGPSADPVLCEFTSQIRFEASNPLEFKDPLQTLAQAEIAMAGVPNVELFNDSTHAKLRESWCAGLLGVGLGKLDIMCSVAVNDSNYRMDADFYVKTADASYDFQLVEAQEPERTRGLEYKRFAEGAISSIPYEPERGHLEGPSWIRAAIEKKIEKRYQDPENLNLLIYANFSAGQLQYDDIREQCEDLTAHFESIWIASSIHLCSISSANALPVTGGWVHVRPIEDYYV